MVQLFVGDKDFRDPKYHEHWSRLEELKTKGFLNKDMSSLELYPGIDLVVAGKLGIGQTVGTRLPADSKATGGKIGYMVMPVFGKGKLAGVPLVDMQGLGISSNAEDPGAAAAFLSASLAGAALAREDEQLWASASASVKLGGEWRLTQEVIARFSNNRDGLYEVEGVTLLGYKIGRNVTLAAGYVHNPQYSGGDFTVMERRAREQVTIDNVAEIGGGKLKPIEDAPGSYVKVKSWI